LAGCGHTEDIDLVHRLWLELSEKGPGAKLHHRDVVSVALRRMKEDLNSDRSQEVIADVVRETASGQHHTPVREGDGNGAPARGNGTR